MKSRRKQIKESRKEQLEHNLPGVVILGDSLTDMGTMAHRKIFGVISGAWVSGLTDGSSPHGEFTNNITWAHSLAYKLENAEIIEEEEGKHRIKGRPIAEEKAEESTKEKEKEKIIKDGQEAAEISDEVIEHSSHIEEEEEKEKITDTTVTYGKSPLVRVGAEGGLTDHNYAWYPSYSISRFFSRLILSTLADKTKLLLENDKKRGLTKEDKAEMIVLEWSGANDLITVNAEPSELEADRAIKAKIENMEKLIKNGYQRIMLYNLPDLSLTPRFTNSPQKQLAYHVTQHFNSELEKACLKLREKYPHCFIEIYDVNKTFARVVEDAVSNEGRKYGFTELGAFRDSQKCKEEIAQNKRKGTPNAPVPADGYIFWDIHPTGPMHERLAKKSYAKLIKEFATDNKKKEEEKKESKVSYKDDDGIDYSAHHDKGKEKMVGEELEAAQSSSNQEEAKGLVKQKHKPKAKKWRQVSVKDITAQQLVTSFITKYEEQLAKDRRGLFGLFRNSNLPPQIKDMEPEKALVEILKHNLRNKKGSRTRKVMTDLLWIGEPGETFEGLDITVLNDAKVRAGLELFEEERSFSKPKNYGVYEAANKK